MPGAGKTPRPEEAAQDRSGFAAPAGESLMREAQVAAESAIAHARKVAATAGAEARLTAASAAALAAAAVAVLALSLVTWICLLALGVWLAVQAGAPVWAALTGAVLLNLGGILLLRFWYGRLIPNLGFARTLSLLRH